MYHKACRRGYIIDVEPIDVSDMTDPTHSGDKTIGSMNGLWGLLFKALLSCFPFFMAWAVWITAETFQNRFFREQGVRVTPSELLDFERRIDSRFDALPPQQWQKKINSLEDKQTAMLESIMRIEAKLEQMSQ